MDADPASAAPGGGRPPGRGRVRQLAAAVLARPRLWREAVAAAVRLAPTGWWRRRPFLPLPDPAYVRFRVQTQTGVPAESLDPDDVVAYLDWCRRFRGLR